MLEIDVITCLQRKHGRDMAKAGKSLQYAINTIGCDIEPTGLYEGHMQAVREVTQGWNIANSAYSRSKNEQRTS